MKKLLASLLLMVALAAPAILQAAPPPVNCFSSYNGVNCGAGNNVMYGGGCATDLQKADWNAYCNGATNAQAVNCLGTYASDPANAPHSCTCLTGYAYNYGTLGCTDCAAGYVSINSQCMKETSVIYDADTDTIVATEYNADEDIVRFFAGASEFMDMDGTKLYGADNAMRITAVRSGGGAGGSGYSVYVYGGDGVGVDKGGGSVIIHGGTQTGTGTPGYVHIGEGGSGPDFTKSTGSLYAEGQIEADYTIFADGGITANELHNHSGDWITAQLGDVGLPVTGDNVSVYKGNIYAAGNSANVFQGLITSQGLEADETAYAYQAGVLGHDDDATGSQMFAYIATVGDMVGSDAKTAAYVAAATDSGTFDTALASYEQNLKVQPFPSGTARNTQIYAGDGEASGDSGGKLYLSGGLNVAPGGTQGQVNVGRGTFTPTYAVDANDFFVEGQSEFNSTAFIQKGGIYNNGLAFTGDPEIGLYLSEYGAKAMTFTMNGQSSFEMFANTFRGGLYQASSGSARSQGAWSDGAQARQYEVGNEFELNNEGAELLTVYNGPVNGISRVTFSSGTAAQNNMFTGGQYNGGTGQAYVVKITDDSGVVDEFQFSDNGGGTWSADIPITGNTQVLSNGVAVKFYELDGHTNGNQWDFDAVPIVKHAYMDVGGGWISGVDASEVDFTNARSIVTHSDTGYGPDGAFMGLVGEAASDDTFNAVGLQGIGKSNGNNWGSGVIGVGMVTNAADTAASYGVTGTAIDSHTGGLNIAVFGTALGGGTLGIDPMSNFSFYGLLGTLANVGRMLIGTGDFADFDNTKALISQGDVGETRTYPTGLVVEAVASSANDGYGIMGFAKGYSGGTDKSGIGVYGYAKPDDTSDTASAVGVYGHAPITHAGGWNIGVNGMAEGGAVNYAFYAQGGDTHAIREDYAPNVQHVDDDETIAATTSFIKVDGDTGAALLDTDPAIADGDHDGQLLIIEGRDDTDTVTIADGVNTVLQGGASMTLGRNDILELIWDATDGVWVERNRSNN